MFSVEYLVAISVIDCSIEGKENIQGKEGFNCVFENFPPLRSAPWWMKSYFNWQREANGNGKNQDPYVPPELPCVIASEDEASYI